MYFGAKTAAIVKLKSEKMHAGFEKVGQPAGDLTLADNILLLVSQIFRYGSVFLDSYSMTL